MSPPRAKGRDEALLFLCVSAVVGSFAVIGPHVELAEAKQRCAGRTVTLQGSNGSDLLRGRARVSDVILARAGNDRVVSKGGRDIICTGSGADTVSSGSGRDLIVAGPAADRVASGLGSDKISAGPGDDIVFGGPGGEQALGGPGADRIYTGQQDDKAIGGPGDDLLIGDHGNDDLVGGDGTDFMRADAGFNGLWGGPGSDWASFATVTPYLGSGTNLDVKLTPHGGHSPHRPEGQDETQSVENVVGSALLDSIVDETGAPYSAGAVRGIGYPVDPAAPTRVDRCLWFGQIDCGPGPGSTGQLIVSVDYTGPDPGLSVLGTPGADRVTVHLGGDSIRIAGSGPIAASPQCTGAGTPHVSCPNAPALGYVLAFGASGNDSVSVEGRPPLTTTVRIDGGPGDDLIAGSGGDDLLDAGGQESGTLHSRDVVLGRGGNDALYSAGDGPDVFKGGRGSDQIVSAGGCDYLDGGPGGSDIAGFAYSTGVNVTVGRQGGCPRVSPQNEILEGSRFPDILVGDNGSDPLVIGHEGNDLLVGRGGFDRLRGDEGSDVLLGGGGRDILEARDGQRDRRLHCGEGGGRALRDRRDPPATRCG
jgi:Ca2+-binding RTX toxin-like protein